MVFVGPGKILGSEKLIHSLLLLIIYSKVERLGLFFIYTLPNTAFKKAQERFRIKHVEVTLLRGRS